MITYKLQCSDGKLFDASQQQEAEQHENQLEMAVDQLSNKLYPLNLDKDEIEIFAKFVLLERQFILNLLTSLS